MKLADFKRNIPAPGDKFSLTYSSGSKKKDGSYPKKGETLTVKRVVKSGNTYHIHASEIISVWSYFTPSQIEIVDMKSLKDRLNDEIAQKRYTIERIEKNIESLSMKLLYVSELSEPPQHINEAEYKAWLIMRIMNSPSDNLQTRRQKVEDILKGAV